MSKELAIKDSWGVASLRQCAGFVDGEEYVAPLGCCLIKWNLDTKENSLQQIHNDLITVMLLSLDGIVLTVGYNGEVKLWSKTFKLLAHFQSQTDNTVFGSWSLNGSRFTITSKGPNQKVLVYVKDDVISQCQIKDTVEPAWSYIAPQTEKFDSEYGSIKDSRNTGRNRPTYDCFNAAIFKANGDVICVNQSKKTCELFLFTCYGDLSKRAIVSPLGDDINDMLCVSQVQDNIVSVGLHKGLFGFYDVDSLDLLTVLQAIGSPHTCIWNGDRFITMSYTSGIMTLWNTDGHLIKEIGGGPTGSIIQMNSGVEDNTVYYLCGIMSLHKVKINMKEDTMTRIHDVSYLSLTGCGVTTTDDGFVASGDFTGKVFVWKQQKRKPQVILNVEAPVRCLLWIQKNVLLIGTLSGQLYCWNYVHNTRESPQVAATDLKILYNFIGDVVTICCNSNQTKLAVGTTAGYLYMFSIEVSEADFNIVEDLNIQIHKPQKQADGSLLNMEIWSLVWSVNDKYIATSSEDRTTIISCSQTGDVIKTLTGHTTAVTGVVWKTLSRGQNMVITCADDQTARIYDGNTFDLLHVVNTHDIYGWHTLTYLCVHEQKDLLFVSTQHGYIVVWDLKTRTRIYCRKLHSGSIEGMTMSPDQQTLLTVGSDCVVNCFSLDNFF